MSKSIKRLMPLMAYMSALGCNEYLNDDALFHISHKKENHVYCTNNGHHKRCYLVGGKWLCPICDLGETE